MRKTSVEDMNEMVHRKGNVIFSLWFITEGSNFAFTCTAEDPQKAEDPRVSYHYYVFSAHGLSPCGKIGKAQMSKAHGPAPYGPGPIWARALPNRVCVCACAFAFEKTSFRVRFLHQLVSRLPLWADAGCLGGGLKQTAAEGPGTC